MAGGAVSGRAPALGAAGMVAALLDAGGPSPALPGPAALREALTALLDALAGAQGDEAERLRGLAARLVEEGCLDRLAAHERLAAALARLEEAGPVSEVVDRAAPAAAAAADLDRVVLSRVDDGFVVAEAVHWRGDAERAAGTLEQLRERPVRLDHPLIESEMVRRRRALLVADPAADPRGRPANAAVLGWSALVCAPVVLDGRVSGFLHGDRAPSGRPVGALERDVLWAFAQGFAQVAERAILRRRVRVQREELRQVASWADARAAELSDGAIDLAADREAPDPAPERRAAGGAADAELRDLLTRRELDVLRLMVRGETNASIARALVVSDGTVKFHVKNILRKLRVANRAEATSRYLLLTYRRDGPPGARRE
jgi:DNA-binding CsgD family transcriptional regulator